MKSIGKLIVVCLIVAGAAAASYRPARDYLRERNRVQFETAKIARGDLTRFVNSTGTIEPVLSVLVGSFVSGPIVELNVDFNDDVRKGDVLAKVDPRLFVAAVDRDSAILASQRADLERIEAQLEQAEKNLDRGKSMRRRGNGFVSDVEYDEFLFQVKSLRAQRKLALASIDQAVASLETSQANLDYCEIVAPVDGVVIDRKIDPGQTLAAQFQTPELFVVAPDLRKTVHVFASVDEADIGLVQKAKQESRPVTFSVDAHPDEVFDGTIEQIRVSSVTNQNVVTYPVVIAASNAELKLLPGMTANISFEVDSTEDVPKIPNAALRFFPDDIELVCEEDRGLIDGTAWTENREDEESLTASDRAAASARRNRRHVWVQDGDKLRAVEIRTGLSESRFTELLSGDLDVGAELVTGKKKT